MRRGDPEIVCWGDGTPTREFLYVDDCAEAIALATERYDGAEPVNIGTGSEISIKELVDTIGTLVGFQGQIVWDATKPNGQPRRCLDTSRAEELFGFRCRPFPSKKVCGGRSSGTVPIGAPCRRPRQRECAFQIIRAHREQRASRVSVVTCYSLIARYVSFFTPADAAVLEVKPRTSLLMNALDASPEGRVSAVAGLWFRSRRNPS